MKIFQAHNSYLFPGGEDTVAGAETALLRAHGHDVIEYRHANHELQAMPAAAKLKFYLNDIYHSRKTYSEVRALIARHKPQVAHFHNSFFVIGPAAYEACFDAGVPVVQTLHNYRFLCAAGTFFRDGKVCEDCMVQGPMAGITHKCWHGSLPASWLMTRVIETYERRDILKRIARFIALSEFSRAKFVQAGWDAGRISVEGNFLEKDPGAGKGKAKHVLYVGALQPYKGVAALLKAWGSRQWPLPLKIAGSGPLREPLQSANAAGVDWLGQQTPGQVAALIKDALCVVVPSECYENFPRVIIEAYACGIPVIASDVGALAELVAHQRTGLLFGPGNANDLAEQLHYLMGHLEEADKMGKAARQVFEQRYTAGTHYQQTMDIYNKVISGT